MTRYDMKCTFTTPLLPYFFFFVFVFIFILMFFFFFKICVNLHFTDIVLNNVPYFPLLPNFFFFFWYYFIFFFLVFSSVSSSSSSSSSWSLSPLHDDILEYLALSRREIPYRLLSLVVRFHSRASYGTLKGWECCILTLLTAPEYIDCRNLQKSK